MVKAHAKINVALKVLDKVGEKYHNVDMVMLPLELHDRVEIEQLPEGDDSFITCDDISVPTDETNCAARAFHALKSRYKFKQNFRIHIHKIIPICAGLGGGSADAAVIIQTLIKKLKLKVSDSELFEIAKEVGADVAFCLFNKPARALGIGEKLEFITVKNNYNVLLVKPRVGVATSECYKKFDELHYEEPVNVDKVVEALATGNDQLLIDEMRNDLEAPALALVPELLTLKGILINDLGLTKVMMTGSGTCFFALSRHLEPLQKAQKQLIKLGYYTRLTTVLK